MDATNAFYPEFVKNQLLTSTQLNQMFNYLDEQDRLSRVKLTGTGKACGLIWEKSANGKIVTIAGGFGITSDGYLLKLAGASYTHWRTYSDPDVDDSDAKISSPLYELWQKSGSQAGQIDILELETEKIDGNKSLTSAQLSGRVLVLYLERNRVDLKSCLVTDCDSKGRSIYLTVRVLLIPENIFNPVASCPSAPTLLSVPRLHTKAPLTEVNTTRNINKGYHKIVAALKKDLTDGIALAFKNYGQFLGLDSAAPWLSDLTGWFIPLNRTNKVNQYYYDVIKDLAYAYNEMVSAACELMTECCPHFNFPRHLMLGSMDGKVGFCNEFKASPVRNVIQSDLLRVRKLFIRLQELIEALPKNLNKNRPLRLTPSHTEKYQLGERAIPWYFENESLQKYWQPTHCCTTDKLWSYYTPGDLNYDYNKVSLIRIEGHLGRAWREGKNKITLAKRQYNVEFNLLVLYLDGAGAGENEIFDKLTQKYKDRKEAKLALNYMLDDAIKEDAFSKHLFGIKYREKIQKIDGINRGIYEFRRRLKSVREERKSLCSVGFLEADYGEVRAEILCMLRRCEEHLSTSDRKYTAAVSYVSEETHVTAIKEAAITRKQLKQRISELGEGSERKALVVEEAAVEADLIVMEAERGMLSFAKKNALMNIANSAATEMEKAEESVNQAGELMAVLRAGNSESIMQLANEASNSTFSENLKELITLLPKQLIAFDFDAFNEAFKCLVVNIIEQRLMHLLKLIIFLQRAKGDIDKGVMALMLKSLMLKQQDIEHALLTVQHDCRNKRLVYIHYLYQYLRAHDNNRFSDFASRNPGMEHLAGVEPGGTFILVAENEDPHAKIVADFALAGSVPCCCEAPVDLCLPPVAMPDYHIEYLHLDEEGEGYQPVMFTLDILSNDYDLNETKGSENSAIRSIELIKEQSELDADLKIISGSQIYYELKNLKKGEVLDRFSYRLKVEGKCSGEDIAQVLVLLVPQVREVPKVGAIAGKITWFKMPLEGHVVYIENSERTAVTDPRGQFYFKNMNAGSYTVRVDLPEFDITESVVSVVEVGKTARADFELPKEKGDFTGNLQVEVVTLNDAGKHERVTNVSLNLMDGVRVVVGVSMQNPDLYIMNDILAKLYTLKVTATGFNEVSVPVVIVAGETTVLEVPMVSILKTIIPHRFVEYVAVDKGVLSSDAKTKIMDLYDKRRKKVIGEVIAVTADEENLSASEAYKKTLEYVTATVQDSKLSERDIIDAYKAVSERLATAIESTDSQSKEKYRVLLASSTKAMMDRISLENPETVKPKTKKALIDIQDAVAVAGVDVERMWKEWSGDELSSDLGLKSIASIKGLN